MKSRLKSHTTKIKEIDSHKDEIRRGSNTPQGKHTL